MTVKVCTQCGAPLHGCNCEYCGNSFNEPSNRGPITLYADNIAVARVVDNIYNGFMTPNEIRKKLNDQQRKESD